MEQALLEIGSKALRKAALNLDAKNFVLSNPIIFQTLKKAADRYIGGENLVETIEKVKYQNSKGFKCSIEFMGENTSSVEEAETAKDEFVQICREVKQQQLNSTISLDLSHIGLKVSHELCEENLDIICRESSSANTDVMISAEGVEVTNEVIEIYKKAEAKHKNVGITLQAYLQRTEDDFKDLIQFNGKIRMVKGAFATPPGLSIPRGEKLDEIYLGYVDQLLTKKHPCSIATHHHEIQQEVKKMIKKYHATDYEFESLYGIRNENLLKLKEEGFKTKIYFVYGQEWYLYLCNRIAEYPQNIFQALNDIVEN